jgi:signal peptidase I
MAGTADRTGEPEHVTGESQLAGGPAPARRRRALAEATIVLITVLLLAFGLRAFVFQAFFIPTSSMVPTLDVGDRILVQKALFNWHDVHEGDIVVFTQPPLDHCGGGEEGDLVKRVIALPGQTIYSMGSNIYVDGRRLSEPYLPRTDPLGPPIPGATRQTPFHVPPGVFYLMGDNRQISCDSRYWGPIKGTTIVGKVVLLWWHHSHPDFHLF